MHPTQITPQVVEELYVEALVLSDEAREAFEMRCEPAEGCAEDLARVAKSVEGLRTTTRLMNVLAWLLNQRAFLSGELSETQLRCYGGLGDQRPSDPEQIAYLEPHTRAVIRDSERLHARIARLDQDWRGRSPDEAGPVRALQGRLAQAFGTTARHNRPRKLP